MENTAILAIKRLYRPNFRVAEAAPLSEISIKIMEKAPTGQRLYETKITPSMEYVASVMARFSQSLSLPAGEGSSKSQSQNSATPTEESPIKFQGFSKSQFQNSDIEWFGDARICSKQVKHYLACYRNGTLIPVHSFVFVLTEDKRINLAYVKDLYEGDNGEKLVRIRYFCFAWQMYLQFPMLEVHVDEVLITSDEEVITAEYIFGIAAVLSHDHYEKCMKFHSYFCHREYKDNVVKPFCPSELPGYSAQPILLSLPGDTEFVFPEPRCRISFKINENVEVLSWESGSRGCWFRCKILYSAPEFLKVQYYDVSLVGGREKLEEIIPSWKLAIPVPDKLGTRCADRLRARPWPCEDLSDCTFEVGAAVDVWWQDGWWEGTLAASTCAYHHTCEAYHHTCEEGVFPVYLTGEDRMVTAEKKNLRVSKDWIDNKWTDVKAKPDILYSLITSSQT